MNGRVVASLTSLLLVAAAGGSAWQARFEEGAAAYRGGDYPAAELAWREVLALGGVDGDLLYDLGNAQFKQGRLGAAILAWRRAQLLLPRDPDLRANLDLARERVSDAVEPQGHVPAFLFWQHSLSLSESATLGALLGGVALALLAWLRWRRRTRGGGSTGYGSLAPLAAAAGVLAVLLAGSTALTARALQAAPPAVILATEAAARSATGADGVELFVLHEGTEVRAAGLEAGYVLVALPDGRRGWLPEAAVGLVLPEAGFPDVGAAP